jgi:hypothetical protein
MARWIVSANEYNIVWEKHYLLIQLIFNLPAEITFKSIMNLIGRQLLSTQTLVAVEHQKRIIKPKCLKMPQTEGQM